MYFEFFKSDKEIWQEGYNDAITNGFSEINAEIFADLYRDIYFKARKNTRDEIAKALVIKGCSYSFAAFICSTSEEHIEHLMGKS